LCGFKARDAWSFGVRERGFAGTRQVGRCLAAFYSVVVSRGCFFAWGFRWGRVFVGGGGGGESRPGVIRRRSLACPRTTRRRRRRRSVLLSVLRLPSQMCARKSRYTSTADGCFANSVATTSTVERTSAIGRPGCIRSRRVRAQIVVWMMRRIRMHRRKDESLGMLAVGWLGG
jgi:hypothetical protein